HASVATAFASTAVVAALVLFLIAAIYRVPPEGAVSLRSSRVESPRLSRGELGLVSLAGGVMIASFAGLGLSAMLMPALARAHDIHWRPGGTTGRCPDDATGRRFAPAKSRGRNGDLFYVVLCRPGGFDSDRGHSPRRKRSRFVHALRTL